RTVDLGDLQRRLDDPGDGDGDPVLELEHVGKRTLEPIGPEMRTRCRVDELGGDAHAAGRPPHGPLEHVAHAELPPDAFDVYVLPLVNKARIARDDKEPADPA